VHIDKIKESDIDDYLSRNGAELARPGNKFGVWHDTATGQVWLDVVRVFPNSATGRAQAISAGRKHNQIAIFHLDSMDEIPTGGTGIAAGLVFGLVPLSLRDTPAHVRKAIHKQYGHTETILTAACHSKACAPPPVGRGGSDSGGSGKGTLYRDKPSKAGSGIPYTQVNIYKLRKDAGVATQDEDAELLHSVKIDLPEGARVFGFAPGSDPKNYAVDIEIPHSIRQNLRRTDLSAVVKLLHQGKDISTAAVSADLTARVAEITQNTLKAEGFTHVILYRGVESTASSDPFDRSSSVRGPDIRKISISSGVTSWTTDAELAAEYSNGKIIKAAVPVEHILSFDVTGNMASPATTTKDPDTLAVKAIGTEVLVSKDASVVSRLVDRAKTITASGLIELACHSAACAPPPVGRGGSDSGGGKASSVSGIKLTLIKAGDPLPPTSVPEISYGNLLPQPGQLSAAAEKELAEGAWMATDLTGRSVTDIWIMTRGIKRKDFTAAIAGNPTPAVKELVQFAVGATQTALAESGVKTVRLYRGVSTGNRSGNENDPLREGVLNSTETTSWTASPDTARQFSSSGDIWAADVPVSQILTWDNVGAQITARVGTPMTRPAIGTEVLVTTHPEAASKIMSGTFPAVPRNAADGDAWAQFAWLEAL
jgi:hypothetical protein